MVAGRRMRDPLFSDAAYKMIAKLSQGIPRNINNICFHALSIAYPLNQRLIDVDIVDEATLDIDLSKESALSSAPCVVNTPTKVNEARSTVAPSKVPMPEPTAGAPAAVPVSTEQQRIENNGARERFRWPQSSSALPQVDSASSTNELERAPRVLADIRKIPPAAQAGSNGAMPAVPVSGYWNLMGQSSAIDDRPSMRLLHRHQQLKKHR
jgi:hypothetical protein